jgi:hypothetical protein
MHKRLECHLRLTKSGWGVRSMPNYTLKNALVAAVPQESCNLEGTTPWTVRRPGYQQEGSAPRELDWSQRKKSWRGELVEACGKHGELGPSIWEGDAPHIRWYGYRPCLSARSPQRTATVSLATSLGELTQNKMPTWVPTCGSHEASKLIRAVESQLRNFRRSS